MCQFAKLRLFVKNRYEGSNPSTAANKTLESEFYFKSSKIKKRKHSECKTCFKNRMLERTKIVWDKTKEIIGDSCKNCGYNRCSAALEFHHLDPDKKDFQISKSRSRNFEKIKTEIEKCILLCANCHREVHSGILILEV